MKKIAFLGLLVVMNAAHAGGAMDVVIPGATLPEQIVQQLTLADQLTQQVTQVQQQFTMLQNQARNLASIPTQMWPSISGNLQQLISITRQAQGLAYSGGDMVSSVQRTYGLPAQTLQNAAQSYQPKFGDQHADFAVTL